jgi:hypothetical protein
MDDNEQNNQNSGVKGQQNESRGFGLGLNGQRVEMKEVVDSGKERLNATTGLSIAGFALRSGQISGSLAPLDGGRLVNGLGPGC